MCSVLLLTCQGLYTGRVSLHTQSTDVLLDELEEMMQSHLAA